MLARGPRIALVSLLALGVASSGPAIGAPPGELSITVVPRSGSGLSRDAALVQLEGDIDTGAPDRLAKALDGVDGPVAIWLNSPGGNLFAGMQLGRLIRARGGSTHIIDSRTLRAGACYSACAMTFLGGVYRFNDNGARYGVHRASLAPGPTGGPDLSGQLTSAIAAYVREMGVDARLLTLWQKAAPEEMYVLSQREALDLAVANNGRQPPGWTLTPGGAQLQGRQEAVDGTGVMIFSCDKERTRLGTVYEPAVPPDVPVTEEWTHTLIVNEANDVAVTPQSVSSGAGSIRATFILPPRLVRLAMYARQIGYRLTPPGARSPTLAYRVDIDDVSRRRVESFLRDCLRAQVP